MDAKKAGVIAAGVAACVLVGAGVEHLRLAAGRAEPVVEAVEKEKAVPKARPSITNVIQTGDAELKASEAALRRRVAELEKALAERPKEPAPVAEEPREEQSREQRDRSRRQSFEQRMEQMKKENPEQYAEMQKRREEFRQNVEQKAIERANFLDAVDTANMTVEQRANHEQLVATVAQVNELMAQMMQGGGNREDGHDMRHQIGEAMSTLGELYENERQYLLDATARAAGYQGDDVSTFTEHIQTIIQNTTMAPGFGGRRGGGDRGGDRGAPAPTP